MSANLSVLFGLVSNTSILATRSNGIVGFRWPDYVAFGLACLGLVTNSINVAVFAHPRLKDVTFRYLLAKSFIILFYFVFGILNEIFFYCAYCPLTFTRFANLYSLAVCFYLNGSISIMRILIEITVSLRTLTILNNRAYLTRLSYKLILIAIALVGLVYYLDRPFSMQVVYMSQFDVYYLAYSSFGLSRAYSVLSVSKEMIRVLLTVGVLTVINSLNLAKFRKRFKQRESRITSIPRSIGSQQNIFSKSISKKKTKFF